MVKRHFRVKIIENGIEKLECLRCKQMLTLDMFNKNRSNKFGYNSFCRQCDKENYKKRKENDIEHYKELTRNERQRHKEQRRIWSKIRYDRYKQEHPNFIHEVYLKRKDKLLLTSRMWNENKSKEYWYNMKSFHERCRRYIKNNGIKMTECCLCHKVWKLVCHHPSYDNYEKRKEVVFVCSSCHKLIHTWVLTCPSPIDLSEMTLNYYGPSCDTIL